MVPPKYVNIGVASAAAAAVGLLVYYRYTRKHRPGSRLRRNIQSLEESGNLQKKYLDEFKNNLGDKNFFMGEEISSTDIRIFGQLASIYYVEKSDSIINLMNDQYPTLVSWLDRCKQKLSCKNFHLSN